MYVYFWTFEKKLNSTKQPDYADSKALNVTLKDGCSVTTPVLEVAMGGENAPFKYNYVEIPNFKRFYFVNDWSYDAGKWICKLSVDVLASYRNVIHASRQFVSRSDAPVVSGASVVMDTVPLTLTASDKLNGGALEQVFTHIATEGFYVIGIIGPNAVVGAVNYFVFTSISELGAFTTKLLDTVDWADVSDVSNELTKCLVNPMQYVVSCKYFPFKFTDLATSTTNIKLGFWDTGISGRKLQTFTKLLSTSIPVPKHPQSEELGHFANLEPYSSYVCDFEPFGLFPINALRLSTTEWVNADVRVDMATGDAILDLLDDNFSFITRRHGKVSIEIPIAAASIGALGVLAGAAGGIMAEGHRVVGDTYLANSITGVANTIASAATNVSISGSQTSRVYTYCSPTILGEFQRIVPDYASMVGRAVCQTQQLGARFGFYMCVRPRLTIDGTNVELEEILTHLEKGVYIQ